MPYTRRRFIKTASRAGLGAAVAPMAIGSSCARTNSQTVPEVTSPKRPPNILLLFPDQWRFDWTSANRNLEIETPNLDRLGKMGTQFQNAVVPAPVCAPSRACLASGREYAGARTPSNNYDYPVGKLTTFYSLLRDRGYYVLGCGKMDLAKASLWWGIDGKWRLSSLGFSDGINNAGKIDQLLGFRLNDNKPADPYMTSLNEQGLVHEHLDDLMKRMKGGYGATFPTPLPDQSYCDNWLGENGLNLLKSAPRDKPWFLQVNWTGPHNPEDITVRMEAKVRGRSMPVTNGVNQYTPSINRTIRQNYTAMCENIDRVIGLYLGELTRNGELDNTIIIFGSDHGEMLGDHGRWGKSVPYHASASVPLMVAGPGIQRGATSTALVSIVDLAATFLEYADAPIPKEMDSRSLRPVLEGKTASHREVVFSALGSWRLVFDGQYKVITGFNPEISKISDDWTPSSPEVEGAQPIVFDLIHDPRENADLFTQMPSAAGRLLKMLPATENRATGS